VALTDKGSVRKTIWGLFIPIAVLVLVVGTTLGDVCHHHDLNTTPENCPICHLSHQAVEPAVASVCTAILVPEGSGPEPLEANSLSRLSASRIPARAPPAADHA
jgi:hypothetical protein